MPSSINPWLPDTALSLGWLCLWSGGRVCQTGISRLYGQMWEGAVPRHLGPCVNPSDLLWPAVACCSPEQLLLVHHSRIDVGDEPRLLQHSLSSCGHVVQGAAVPHG